MQVARSLPLVLLTFVFVSMAAPVTLDAGVGSWFGLGGKEVASASPKKDANATTASKTPQLLSKMTGGTKRLVSNTTGMFKPKTVTTRKSGLTGVQKAKKPEQPKQGLIQSMLHPEPPPPPKTIKEWMSLKQIHP